MRGGARRGVNLFWLLDARLAQTAEIPAFSPITRFHSKLLLDEKWYKDTPSGGAANSAGSPGPAPPRTAPGGPAPGGTLPQRPGPAAGLGGPSGGRGQRHGEHGTPRAPGHKGMPEQGGDAAHTCVRVGCCLLLNYLPKLCDFCRVYVERCGLYSNISHRWDLR